MIYHAPISGALLESVDIASQASFGALVNGVGADMRGWDGVAALIAVAAIAGAGTWQASLQMADDAAFTQNLTTITDAGTGQVCQSPAAATTTGTFWLEAYRPWRRFVRVSLNPLVANVTAAAYLLRYRHTGLYPVTARDSLGLTNRVAVRAA